MPAPATAPLAEARSRLEALDRAVREAQQRLGGGLEVRRVRTDLDHLRESLALLCDSVAGTGAATGPGADTAAPPGIPAMAGVALEIVRIPDTPYDPEMWRGIDDEGIGCRHR